MRDKHHILFPRRIHEVYSQSKAIREVTSLVPRIDRELHEDIHRHVPLIPFIGTYALQRTFNSFHPTGKTLEDIGRLSMCIEDSVDHPKAHDTEKRLAQIAVEGLEIQRYMLKDELRYEIIGRRYL